MQEPSATRSTEPDAAPIPALPGLGLGEVARHGGLLLATAVSVVVTYASNDEGGFRARAAWVHGATFAGALLLILLAHELGHYVAARLHGVEATLPFFLPLPFLSPFGTMGAVIRMRGTIPSRRALLDIGASGPLAGLAFALPLYAWGVRHSVVVPDEATLGGTLGESVLTRSLDALFGPHLTGGTLQASPVLFAAWAGLFVTMLNLLPIGQLDGGHVAYALFGTKQDRAAVIVHRSLLVFFFVSLAGYVLRDLSAGLGFYHLGRHVNDSLFWLVWFEILGVLGTVTTSAAPEPRVVRRAADEVETLTARTRIAATVLLSLVAAVGREHSSPSLWAAWFVGLAVLLAMEVRGGTLRRHALFDHPSVARGDLGALRTVVAVVTLVFFALLFMPTPMSL